MKKVAIILTVLFLAGFVFVFANINSEQVQATQTNYNIIEEMQYAIADLRKVVAELQATVAELQGLIDVPASAVQQGSHEIIGDSEGVAFVVQSNPNQNNIVESGSFLASADTTLILEIYSNIRGGSVDFFLFDPNGVEHRLTISSSSTSREFALSAGVWQFTTFGAFREGNITITGSIN